MSLIEKIKNGINLLFLKPQNYINWGSYWGSQMILLYILPNIQKTKAKFHEYWIQFIKMIINA